jgi:hypothetical protein
MLPSNWEGNPWPFKAELLEPTLHIIGVCEYHIQQNEKMSLTRLSSLNKHLPFCSKGLKRMGLDKSTFFLHSLICEFHFPISL